MNKKSVINFLMVLAGTFLLSMSVEFFILPYNILSGGVAGLAVAFEPFFHIDKTLFANSAVIGFLILGAVILGKEFALTTMLSSLAYPIFNNLLIRVPNPITVDPILAALYAGLLGGTGIGIVMRAGSSTGGMDIPALILHKFTGIQISILVIIIDTLTVGLGIAAYGINSALLGLVSVFASGFAIGKVLSAGQGANAKSVHIISSHWEELRDGIYQELNRGVTILDGRGGFNSETKNIVLVVVSTRQYASLISLINRIDPKAFVITNDASDMHGEGFTYASSNI